MILTRRALHPRKPLPKPDDDILEMLNAPKKLSKAAEPYVSQIKQLFPLVKVVQPTKAQLFAKLQKISATAGTDVDIQAIVEQVLHNTFLWMV